MTGHTANQRRSRRRRIPGRSDRNVDDVDDASRATVGIASTGGVEPLVELSSHLLGWPLAAAGLVATAAIAVAGAIVARLLGLQAPRVGSLLGASGFRVDDEDDRSTATPAAVELTDDERFVVGVLRANGGQTRQARIVQESTWSKSKVSRLLSRMEQDGHVEKVPAGRENVVVLALESEE